MLLLLLHGGRLICLWDVAAAAGERRVRPLSDYSLLCGRVSWLTGVDGAEAGDKFSSGGISPAQIGSLSFEISSMPWLALAG